MTCVLNFSFGIFWAGRPEDNTKSKIDPWLEECYKTRQDFVADDLYYIENIHEATRRRMRMSEQIDLRDIIKKKAQKHSHYYRSLYIRKDESDTTSEMAPDTSHKTGNIVQTSLQQREHEEQNKKDKSRQRRVGVFEMTENCESGTSFKGVKILCEKYQDMIEQTKKDLNETKLNNSRQDSYLIPPVSGYCSSSASAGSDDEKERSWYARNKGHAEVRRYGSSDSAVGLTQSDDELSNVNTEVVNLNSQWVDACEKNDVNVFSHYSPYSPRGSIDHINVPTKTLLEAQYFSLPLTRKLSDCPSDVECEKDDARRQSCFTDDGDEQARCRFWRTPSVVVSDYSDDVVGLTLEDIEYFRTQRKDNSSPDSSLHSSCSNLNYCGSTISSLDAEYIFRKPFRKGSDCSTCSTFSGDEIDSDEKHFQSSAIKVSDRFDSSKHYLLLVIIIYRLEIRKLKNIF